MIDINIEHLNKIYKLYSKPSDRLKEALNVLKKQYHTDFYALKDISFAIEKGETVGIVGKNGSGKSTLLKILTGVLTPTSGRVGINGRVSALLELGAGFNGDYSGLDNIYINGTILGYSRAEMDAKLDDIIRFADIGDYLYQPMKTYSSGMYVRLAFAVAINVDPQILIVDEALAVGDTRFQLKCMNKFLEFKNKGITIIFVSHDINAIKRFCDRTLWINEGRLIEDGDTDTVTDHYLDYLKELDAKAEETQSDSAKSESDEASATHEEKDSHEKTVDIAEITKVEFVDAVQEKTGEIRFGDKVQIKIEYYVKDDTIVNPVLGAAILRVDNFYVCGVNTLLDKIKIPWKKGYNSFTLTYHEFNLVGGSYYFDVALYDQTATVAFDYRARYKEFFVKMKYVAEGITVLPHQWSEGI